MDRELGEDGKNSSFKLDVYEAVSEVMLDSVSFCVNQDSSCCSNMKISPEQNFRTSESSTIVPSFSKTRFEPTISSLILLFAMRSNSIFSDSLIMSDIFFLLADQTLYKYDIYKIKNIYVYKCICMIQCEKK